MNLPIDRKCDHMEETIASFVSFSAEWTWSFNGFVCPCARVPLLCALKPFFRKQTINFWLHYCPVVEQKFQSRPWHLRCFFSRYVTHNMGLTQDNDNENSATVYGTSTRTCRSMPLFSRSQQPINYTEIKCSKTENIVFGHTFDSPIKCYWKYKSDFLLQLTMESHQVH